MKIKVCIGSSCHLKGSKPVVEKLRELIQKNTLQDKVDLAGEFCMSKCQDGVCVSIDGEVHSVKPETVEMFFENEINKKLH